MGEVESIRSRVSNKADYKVNLSGFRAGTFDEPPIDNVLATNFWKSPQYEMLRRRLAKAVPTLTVLIGGDYITINSQSGKTSVNEEMVLGSQDDSQVRSVSDCLCCHKVSK